MALLLVDLSTDSYYSSQLPRAKSTWACASIRCRRQRIGHDRLVAQPVSREPAHTDTVLGRNIACAIQVGIHMIATLPTLEHALGTTVVAGPMPTAATALRGMSRVYHDHRTTPF